MSAEPETEGELADDAAERLLAMGEPRRHRWVNENAETLPQTRAARAADGVNGFTREGLRMAREASLIVCVDCADKLKSRVDPVSMTRPCPGAP